MTKTGVMTLSLCFGMALGIGLVSISTDTSVLKNKEHIEAVANPPQFKYDWALAAFCDDFPKNESFGTVTAVDLSGTAHTFSTCYEARLLGVIPS